MSQTPKYSHVYLVFFVRSQRVPVLFSYTICIISCLSLTFSDICDITDIRWRHGWVFEKYLFFVNNSNQTDSRKRQHCDLRELPNRMICSFLSLSLSMNWPGLALHWPRSQCAVWPLRNTKSKNMWWMFCQVIVIMSYVRSCSVEIGRLYDLPCLGEFCCCYLSCNSASNPCNFFIINSHPTGVFFSPSRFSWYLPN